MSFICIVCRDVLTTAEENDPQGAAAFVPINNVENDIVATKCGHLYHLHCLMGWFNTQGYGRAVSECPYCKTLINGPMDYTKIFPSGDEETDAILAANSKSSKVNAVKCLDLQNELSQVHEFLTDSERKLEDESLNNDILKFEFAQKLSELDLCKREMDKLTEKLAMKEAAHVLKCESLIKQMDDLNATIQAHQKHDIELDQYIQNQKLEYENDLEKRVQTIHELNNQIVFIQNSLQVSEKKEELDKGCQTENKDMVETMMSNFKFFDSCIKLMMEEKMKLQETLFDLIQPEEFPPLPQNPTFITPEVGDNVEGIVEIACGGSDGNQSGDQFELGTNANQSVELLELSDSYVTDSSSECGDQCNLPEPRFKRVKPSDENRRDSLYFNCCSDSDVDEIPNGVWPQGVPVNTT